jgi:predicted nuclease of restriction endonuclease-like (RecB) superfamily
MSLENTYAATIAQIKTEIETVRLKAAISVNQHLLMLYWKIGSIILQQQSTEGWGTKVIERLSNDLCKEFPDMKGTSSRNLKYMRTFAEAYPEFVQQPAAQLPWFHICTLLDKVKSKEERQFTLKMQLKMVGVGTS